MKVNKIFFYIRKNWINLLLYTLLGIFIFSPGAKSWLLKQFVSTGLFNAEIKNETRETLPAPSFTFKDSKGKTSDLADFKGKVIFLNFWASWCPPCRAEMNSLNDLYLSLRKDENVIFIFIKEDEEMTKAKRYLEENHFSIPVYLPDGNIPPKIFNGTLPTTVILDREGKIVLKHTGMAKYNTKEFINELKAL